MSSIFKTLFRKDSDSQPIPAALLSSENDGYETPSPFMEFGEPMTRAGLAEGLGGPFFEGNRSHMTVRELAALLPPTLLRFDGVSPEQAVVLPLETLRSSMQTGRPSVRLSQIHSACPLLFQRDLLPGEDREVTLPIARVKGMLEVSAPLPDQGGAFAESINPFAARQRGATGPIPMQSPFAAPVVSGGRPSPKSQPFAAAAGSPCAPAAAAHAGSPFAAEDSVKARSPFLPSTPVEAPPVMPMTPPAASPFATVSQPTGHPFPASAAASPPNPFSVIPAPAVRIASSPFALATPPSAPVTRPTAQEPPFPASGRPQGPSDPVPFSSVTKATSPFALVHKAQLQPSTGAPEFPEASPFSQNPAPIVPGSRQTPASAIESAWGYNPPALAVDPAPVLAPAIFPPERAASGFPRPTAPVSPASQSKIESGATVTLGLRAILRDADALQLGFDPANVPESVKLTLPLELISSQLATGRVELGISEVCSGIVEKFRPAFVRAAADYRIVVPMSEVFHNLPESARPRLEPDPAPANGHQSITTSPFQTPFAIRAEADRTLAPPPLELPTLRPAMAVAPPSGGPEAEASGFSRNGMLSQPPGSGGSHARPPRVKSFAGSPIALRPFPRPDTGPDNPSPAPAHSPVPPIQNIPPLGRLPVSPQPIANQTGPDSPEADDLGESFSAARLNNEPPPRAGSAPVPSPVVTGTVPALTAPTPQTLPPLLPAWPPAFLRAPLPSTAPVSFPMEATSQPPGAPAAGGEPGKASIVPAEDLSFGCVIDSRQLTLRAVLGTDQALSLQDIVDKCAALPGLKGAVFFRNGHTLISQGTDLAEAAAFRISAGKARESLVALAESMGLGSDGNFTLRTDNGIRSFFLHSGHCLAVWHTLPAFTPGTREKLILITQEIARA